MTRMILSIILFKIKRLFHLLRKKGTFVLLIKSIVSKMRHAIYIFRIIRSQGIKSAYNYLYANFIGVNGNPLIIKYIQENIPYPNTIWVEPTTRCNLRCIICEHTYWNELPRDISFKQFETILNQFPKLKAIVLTGIGESFLNKDFMKMVELVKSRRIFTEITDNFSLINEEVAERLIDLKIDRLVISMDGATKKIYEHMRPGSNYDKIIYNINTFIETRRRRRAFFPKLDMHYIICKENMEEIINCIELVYSFGSNEISELRFTRLLYKYNEVKDIYCEVPGQIMERANEKALALGINIAWGVEIPEAKPPINLCVNWVAPFIFASGDVIPCAVANEGNVRDFQRTHSMGNIFETPFRDIWRGENYKAFFSALLKENRAPHQCTNCCIYDTTTNK